MPTIQEKLLLEELALSIEGVVMDLYYDVPDSPPAVTVERIKKYISQAFQTLLESRDAQIVEMLKEMLKRESNVSADDASIDGIAIYARNLGYNDALFDIIKSLVHSK